MAIHEFNGSWFYTSAHSYTFLLVFIVTKIIKNKITD